MSRRILKKEIQSAFDIIYQDIILYETFVVNADTEKSEKLLMEVVDIEADFISRVSAYDGKEAKGRVKIYFNKLKSDLKNEISTLSEKITALPH